MTRAQQLSIVTQAALWCHAGDDWRLEVTVRKLQYVPTAADILHPCPLEHESVIDAVMRGRLTSACVCPGPVRLVRGGRPFAAVLQPSCCQLALFQQRCTLLGAKSIEQDPAHGHLVK
jgi:hypothetical protein